jgi:hypothetical protein
MRLPIRSTPMAQYCCDTMLHSPMWQVGIIQPERNGVVEAKKDDLIQRLRELLGPLGPAIQYSKPPTRSIPASADSSPNQPTESHVQCPTIFYIGEESLGLTNLLITNATSNVGNSKSKSLIFLNIARLYLMIRQYLRLVLNPPKPISCSCDAMLQSRKPGMPTCSES